MIIYTVLTLLIPTVIGFCYHVLPGILSTDEIQVANVIQVEGYIYRNLYSNILLFIPFLIYYLIKEKREKKINFDVIALVVVIAYMCVLYAGIFKLNISTYYFFKMYFVLWQFVIYLFYRGICYIIQDKKYGKYLSIGYIGIYIAIMIYSLLYHKVPITKQKFNENEKVTDVMDIYGINKTVLFNIADDYSPEELKILDYVKENQLELKDNNTLILGNQRQEYWFHAMLEYRFKDNLEYATTIKDIEKWNSGSYKYLICFYRSDYYKIYKNKLKLENIEILYENESGIIFKYKEGDRR